MITAYMLNEKAALERVAFDNHQFPALENAVWIDCLLITPEEEAALEAAFSLELPTREEMREIEISSRLYKKNYILYMTANIVSNTTTDAPQSEAITFIMTERTIITLRYTAPRPFEVFANRALQSATLYTTCDTVFLGLLDTIVDRSADILEAISDKGDSISARLFNQYAPTEKKPPASNLPNILCEIGKSDDLLGKVHQSLASINRMLKFFHYNFKQTTESRKVSEILENDIISLVEYSSFLSNKISFQLDATLGRIAGEQNNVIRIFSLIAVIFVPPTLIASIYGMNFHFMPELSWKYGYLWAFILMIASAVIPFLYFKKRKWL